MSWRTVAGENFEQCSAPCQAAGPVMQKFMPVPVSGLQRVRGKPLWCSRFLRCTCTSPPTRGSTPSLAPASAASPFALDQLEEQPRGLLYTKSRPFGHRITSDQRGRLCIRLAGQSPSLQPGSRVCFRLNIPRSTTPKPTRQAVIDMSSFGRLVFSLRGPRKMTEDQGTVP